MPGTATPPANRSRQAPRPAWDRKAPLWFYVLAEAERQQGGRRLGEVGGRIVTEVILDADHDSYLHAQPAWRPTGDFRMGDLLKAAGAA